MAHLKKSATTGHLLKNSAGHLVNECSGGVPCVCACSELEWRVAWPCHGLVQRYRLGGGITGASFVGCAECDDDSGTPWNGRFIAAGQPCSWERDDDNWGIGGKIGFFRWYQSIYLSTLVDPSQPCYWILHLNCEGNGMHTIWYGTKTTGATPVGTYLYISGCDTHLSLDVEEAA